MYSNNYKRNILIYWRQWYPEWNIPEGFHVHHIKPKCTFDNPADPRIHHPRNLIALHPDDHVTIHRLRGDLRSANGGFLNMRDYKHSEATKQKMQAAAKIRPPQSKETKLRRSKTMQGKPKTAEHVQRMVAGRAGWEGHKADAKKKISKSSSERQNSPMWRADNTFECPHCERSIIGKGAFNRWHGDNCKDVI